MGIFFNTPKPETGRSRIRQATQRASRTAALLRRQSRTYTEMSAQELAMPPHEGQAEEAERLFVQSCLLQRRALVFERWALRLRDLDLKCEALGAVGETFDAIQDLAGNVTSLAGSKELHATLQSLADGEEKLRLAETETLSAFEENETSGIGVTTDAEQLSEDERLELRRQFEEFQGRRTPGAGPRIRQAEAS